MVVETVTIPVQSRFGVTVYNSLLAHDPASDRLLVLLPGKGYTCHHPVLYYLRRAALALGYDALSVEYGFQIANAELDANSVAWMQADVEAALRPVLVRGYRRVCIAAKSLGTALAGELARMLPEDSVSLLLLTPIGGALQGLGSIPTLAVFGAADALYTPEVAAAYTGHPTIVCRVFDGLNHSLEMKGSWRESLAVLPEIIAVCEDFLRREG
ncbi:MAG: hypothetical protein HZC41_23415 [Chloroflexi bacterium]|nr:hypothetical protein [Chloroflexota bacterium]